MFNFKFNLNLTLILGQDLTKIRFVMSHIWNSMYFYRIQNIYSISLKDIKFIKILIKINTISLRIFFFSLFVYKLFSFSHNMN